MRAREGRGIEVWSESHCPVDARAGTELPMSALNKTRFPMRVLTDEILHCKCKDSAADDHVTKSTDQSTWAFRKASNENNPKSLFPQIRIYRNFNFLIGVKLIGIE